MSKQITTTLSALLEIHQMMRGAGSTEALIDAAKTHNGLLVVLNTHHAVDIMVEGGFKSPAKAISLVSLSQSIRNNASIRQPLLVDNGVVILIAEESLSAIQSLESEVNHLTKSVSNARQATQDALKLQREKFEKAYLKRTRTIKIKRIRK